MFFHFGELYMKEKVNDTNKNKKTIRPLQKHSAIKLLGAMLIVAILGKGGTDGYPKTMIAIKNRVNDIAGQITQSIYHTSASFASRENNHIKSKSAAKNAYMAKAHKIIATNRHAVEQFVNQDPDKRYQSVNHKPQNLNNDDSIDYSNALIATQQRVNEMNSRLSHLIQNTKSQFANQESYNKLPSVALKNAYMAKAKSIISSNRQMVDQFAASDPFSRYQFSIYADYGRKTAQSVLTTLRDRSALALQTAEQPKYWLRLFDRYICKTPYNLSKKSPFYHYCDYIGKIN